MTTSRTNSNEQNAVQCTVYMKFNANEIRKPENINAALIMKSDFYCFIIIRASRSFPFI